MEYMEGKAKVPDSGPLHYVPYLMLLTANTFWTLSWIHSNENNINPIQTTIIRSITGFLFNYFVCRWRGYTMDIKDMKDLKLMVGRNILLTFHSFTMAVAQFILPLPIVHTISCSGVLIVFVLDYFLYGILINKWQYVGILIGFGGVVLNANGNLITELIGLTAKEKTNFENYLTEDPFKRSLFALLMVGIVAGWAYSLVLIKDLKQYNSFQLNFSMTICQSVVSGISYPMVESSASLYHLCMGFLFTGIPITIAQFFFVGGITMSKETGTLTMMNFIAVGIGYLVSIFRYN